jgi:hypothetical protein
MADFGDFMSGAGSGALTGFGMGGPLGAAIGGLGGGLISMFTDPNKPEQHAVDPNQGQIDAGINSLMSSRAGAQMAQNQSAGYRRDARAAFDAIQANPNVAGNANVMSALYNKAQSTAADASTNAASRGAEIDQRSREQGLQAAQQRAGHLFQEQQYNNQVDQQNQRPGFFQQILQSTMATGAGAGLSKLMGSGGASDPTASAASFGRPGGLTADIPSNAQQGSTNMDLISKMLGLASGGGSSSGIGSMTLSGAP